MFVRLRGGAGVWAAGMMLALLAVAPVIALAAHPFGVPEAGGAGGGGSGWLSGVFAQVSVWQSHFYRQLTGALRAWQAEGGAGWTLIGLSFAYGIFHALGPGHGKAVISAYVLANRQTARNGAVLAMLSALIQALVAIVAVAVLAWLLNVTAATMNRATQWLETASFTLIVALGLWLVWRKAMRPLTRGWQRRGLADTSARGHTPAHTHEHADGDGQGNAGAHRHDHAHSHRHGESVHGHLHSHDHEDGHMHGHPHAHPAHLSAHSHAQAHHHVHVHVHVHDDDCGCGHAHVPDPRDVEGTPTLRRSVTALLAVGLRPCSGALIVLVFSLSQNFFGAGMASALAMGLGTGLTVAALVMLAVLARDTAGRFSAAMSTAWAARLRYLIEAAAAVAVLALGALLLGGQLATA